MKKKQDTVHTMKLAFGIIRQKGWNKYFLGIFYFWAGCFAFFAFAFLFTSADIFAWLMDGAMGMTAVVGVVGMLWNIRNAVKQIKRENSLFD